MRGRKGFKRGTVGALLVAVAAFLATASTASASFSIEDFSVTSTSSQSGAHPDVTTELNFSTIPHEIVPGLFGKLADGNVRDLDVDLPAGLLGDPSAVPQCKQAEFAQNTCPASAQVGYAAVTIRSPIGFPVGIPMSVYNIEPRNDEETAELAFSSQAVTVNMPISVRTDGDYGLTSHTTGIILGTPVTDVTLTLWGVPGDPSHDAERYDMFGNPVAPPHIPLSPFFTNPTACGPITAHASANSYQEPTVFQPAESEMAPIEGCDRVKFEPSLKARPTTDKADQPSGLDFNLHMPQHDEVAQNELQSLAVSATEGQFVLGFEGEDTTDIAFNASAGEVQAALEALPGIGAGNVAVNGGPGDESGGAPYAIAFKGALAQTDVEQLSVSDGTAPLQITNGSGTVSGIAAVTTKIAGTPPGAEGTELATSPVRDVTVTLPKGLVVNPSSANGLGTCSPAQIGMLTPSGDSHPHFNRGVPSCPGASNLGTVKVITPTFDDPLKGRVYLASPHQNPFGSLLALYLTIEGHGLHIKLAGRVDTDPQTGRISSTFAENPQLPTEDLELQLNSGALAPLRTPATCGTYATTSSMTPWSAPGSGPPSTPKDEYAITRGPDGGACPSAEAELPNAPSFEAGSVSAIAGQYKPFVVNLRREDGTQQFSSVSVSPPAGLVAKLAGTQQCSDAAIASAATKSGAAEKATPSCPASSAVGSVYAAAGAGPTPYNAPGTAYLAGPYKGAPLSLAIITPATAGPFDLGTIVVRTALYLDSKTAQVKAVSDPIPTILEGIPLDVRSVSIRLDKPQFTLNPTSCDPTEVTGSVLSTLNSATPVSSRFQLAECGRLKFGPQMALSLKGDTKRGGHPALTAVLKARPGDANISSVQVALPRSEFLAQNHIRTVCTRVQFSAGACPQRSIYGKVTVTTPLVDYPLSGPVYLRSSDNTLPDLVLDLHGPPSQPIHFEAAGKTDSIRGGIRNTFSFVPDVPFTKVTVRLQAGKKGLLENSRDICATTNKAQISFTAHNGEVLSTSPPLKAKCGAKAKKKGKSSHHKHG